MKLLEFIVASSLLTLMPGPDILFVMAQSIVQGRKTGIAVALGLCSGLFVHTALAALGISLIIASSPILFAAIRYAGIAYLIYMGIVSLRSRNDASVSIADSTATLQNESAGTFGKLYRTGITMNLLNPKIILFFLAFFPQFLDKTSATPRIDILILGTTFAAVAITIWSPTGSPHGSAHGRSRRPRWPGSGPESTGRSPCCSCSTDVSGNCRPRSPGMKNISASGSCKRPRSLW